MKALIAIGIAFSSISASAMTLCLGQIQAPHVPSSLNIRLEAEIDETGKTLTLRHQNDPTLTWAYTANGDALEARLAKRQCQNLGEDYLRERFKVTMEQKSANDRIAALLMLQIGFAYEASIGARNLCNILGKSQVFHLVEPRDSWEPQALLGKVLLLSRSESEVVIMEGGLGFIYHERACLPARLK